MLELGCLAMTPRRAPTQARLRVMARCAHVPLSIYNSQASNFKAVDMSFICRIETTIYQEFFLIPLLNKDWLRYQGKSEETVRFSLLEK